ncbi:MAG: hypothetical protein WDO73_15895 [Ignavibacteriota bacterium]
MEDEQIMWEVRAGDVGKLEQLFDRHHRSLVSLFSAPYVQPKHG